MNWIVYWGISSVCGSGLLLTEFYLSRKKKWFAGFVPILLIAILFFGLETFSYTQMKEYRVFTDSYQMENGFAAEMTVKQNGTRSTVAFSDLMIKDQNGILRDKAGVGFQEKEIFCKYEEAAAYFQAKYNLQGDSSRLETANARAVSFGNTSVSEGGFFRTGILILLPLILIFILNRIIYRNQHKRKEIQEMGIRIL